MTEITCETLELAALAGGLPVQEACDGYLTIRVDDFKSGYSWRPHTNPADALELAVRLGIRVTPPKYKGNGSGAEPLRGNTASCTAFRTDPVEQTCVAITLCAAEIGRQMKEAK